MFNGMMDPEMMRLAQEQMNRISPQELAKIQKQMMSNPELMRLASESMKNLRPEDVKNAAEQLKHARPEDMVEISEKIANATPEELAAIRARAEAQASYELNAARMLKKQGNELHSHGKFHDALQKYLLAKKNLKGIPISKCKTLQLQCSLNLMSCYLKTRQFEDCIKEGSEVLSYDLENIKALYRRGQAYKELGNLEAAISDLSKAHELSPEDETIADVLRDANEKLMEDGGQNVSRGLVIEEIVEEDTRPLPPADHGSSAEYSVSPAPDVGEYSQNGGASDNGSIRTNDEYLQRLNGNPETARLFQNYMSNANPESLGVLGSGGLSPEMVKTATDMISKMKPEELQKLLEVASSLNGKGPMFPSTDNNGNQSKSGSQFPEMTPEMVKMASERLSKMSPQELQKMVDVASSLKTNGGLPVDTANDGSQRRNSGTQCSAARRVPSTENIGMAESSSGGLLSNSTMDPSSMSLPTSTADLQENMRNTMRDPAMRQMFSSMMKNMSPEMMASMSEQFGMKLSMEEAAKAQQAMSSLSPADLDRMMRWAEVAQNGVATLKKTKNWLLGRPGMILAICMLILALILHRLGFIGS